MISKHYIFFFITISFINNSSGKTLSCFFCNSTLNYNCATNPIENLSTKDCNQDEDICVVYIKQNETIRDCGKSGKSKLLHHECKTNLCNNIVFPVNRLKCYQCDGFNCFNNISESAKICKKYVPHDTCFTAVIDEKDAIRGCTSDVELKIPFLQTCEKSECNNQPSISENICIECEGKSNIDCIRNKYDINFNIEVNNFCSVNTLYGRSNEECFTYHRFENVSRGCLSKAGKLLLEPKYLKTCVGKNCNTLSIPIQKCVTCTGNVTNPECDGEVITCSKQDTMCHVCYVGYVTKIIKRGCGFSDTKDMECNKCQNKDGCNNDNLKTCITCTSENHSNCILDNSIYLPTYKACELANSTCITMVNSRGYFERGCSSEILKCDPLNKRNYCRECKSNNCNNETIEESENLKCHQCGGISKCSTKLIKNGTISSPVYSCSYWKKNNFCFEYINEFGNVERGCKSNYKEFSKCLLRGKKCLTCNTNGCNNVLVTRQETNISCVVCNSLDEPSCRWSREWYSPCNSYPFLNEGEHCYTYTNELGFTKRGCSLEDGFCLEHHSSNCKVCNTIACNNKVSIPQVCLNGTLTEGAENNELRKIECISLNPIKEENACYVRRNGTKVTWGCLLHLNETEIRECNNLNDCKTCFGNSCELIGPPPLKEHLVFMQCHTCHSIINPDCATNPKNIPATNCASQEQCYTGMIGTATVRGCISPDIIIPDFKKCSTRYCNNQIFPEDRLKCHQCNGTVDCSLKQNVYLTTPCKTYNKETDGCFEYLLESKHVVRGCISDNDEYRICEEHILDCKECNTNGCNNKYGTLKKPVLFCIKCNSEMDENCKWTQNSTFKEICTNVHSSETSETCYSTKRKNGSVQRGCSIDDKICYRESCVFCSANGCNNNLLIPQVCLQGVVKMGEKDKPISNDCTAIIQTNHTQGCFVKKSNNEITWGCAVDLESSELENCKNITFKHCNFCMNKDCEKMKAPFSENDENSKGNADSPLFDLKILFLITIFLIFNCEYEFLYV